jgi:arylsulfatase A-like enzyme
MVRAAGAAGTPCRGWRCLALVGAGQVLVALLVAGALLAGWPAAVARSPDVLLVTIDTCRADVLGCYGAPGGLTPALDRLSRGGRTWLGVRTDVPLTLPAHTSLLTGLSVREHGVRSNAGRLAAGGVATLAERFAAAGYATAAVVSGQPLVRAGGLDRGFAIYEDDLPRAGPDRVAERPAGATAALALEVMGRLARPFLLWVHFYDPHEPYEPPWLFDELPGGYAGEVARVDRALERLLHGFAARSGPGGVVAVVGDHGEDLGQHGERTHGIFLYDSVMHVPALLGRIGGGSPRLEPGPRPIHWLQGVVLGAAGLTETEGAVPPDGIYMETTYPSRKYGWANLRALVSGRFKLVLAPRSELYDLEADPGETRNLADAKPRRAAAMRRLLAGMAPAPRPDSVPTPDPERREQLESLGYAAGGREDSPRGIDPKEGVRILPAIEEAVARLRSGETAEAVRWLEELQNVDPRNPLLMNNLGIGLLRLGRCEESVRWFEACTRHDPGNARWLNNLGMALKCAGHLKRAIETYRKAVERDPRFAAARYNLGVALLAAGREDEARVQFAAALELDPAMEQAAEALRLLGRP